MTEQHKTIKVDRVRSIFEAKQLEVLGVDIIGVRMAQKIFFFIIIALKK